MASEKIWTGEFVSCSLAQFTFSSVFFVLIPTIPIYLVNLGSKEAEIGVLVGALSVCSILLRPIIGRALLRIPEIHFMIGGASLYAISSLAYVFAGPFWPFFFVRILQGIGMAFFVTASFTLVLRISPEARRGESVSYFYLPINSAFALAPSFGMFLINEFNFNVLFAVCAGLSLFSLVITWRLRGIEGPSPETGPTSKTPLVSREAIPPAVMAFMGSAIWGAMVAFFPLYALGQGMSNPGLFFGAMAITLISGRFFGGRLLDLYERERVILPCLVTQVVAMILLSFSKTVPMFILVAVIWGGGNAFFYPTLVTYAVDLAGGAKGPAIGTYMALSDFGAGMGSVIMGVVLQWTNYQTMFLCLALIGVLNLLYFYFAILRRRLRYADL